MTDLEPGGTRHVLPVLVVGAGPVGLAAAADLSRRGVPVRCIDAAAGPSPRSRTLVVWPRTVDVLRGLGGERIIAERSMPLESFHYYSSARRIARIEFTERTRPLVLPQPQVEELLTATLELTGTTVAWNTRLVGLAQDGDAVTARLHTAGGVLEERFSYVVGCDGVTLDLVQDLLDQRGPGGLRLHDADWVSTFAVHARHTDRYRLGRVFLAGDAAHSHSPAGGQGLNSGITDAHNLAWKLALAWHGHAGERLLASYEPERRQVTRAVLRQADLQTRAWLVRKPHHVWLRDTPSAPRRPPGCSTATTYPGWPACAPGTKATWWIPRPAAGPPADRPNTTSWPARSCPTSRSGTPVWHAACDSRRPSRTATTHS
jgi:2-polyprenyl-6-methoxyphenol hydroxylase-like FAD-dependent oxidoreductase